MTARNDITGDAIATKQPTDAYRDGWDRIFRGTPPDVPSVEPDKTDAHRHDVKRVTGDW